MAWISNKAPIAPVVTTRAIGAEEWDQGVHSVADRTLHFATERPPGPRVAAAGLIRVRNLDGDHNRVHGDHVHGRRGPIRAGDAQLQMLTIAGRICSNDVQVECRVPDGGHFLALYAVEETRNKASLIPQVERGLVVYRCLHRGYEWLGERDWRHVQSVVGAGDDHGDLH